MKKNLPLLRKVLNHITNHPEEWDQAAWVTLIPASEGTTQVMGLGTRQVMDLRCKTALCFAGTTVFSMHSAVPVIEEDVIGPDDPPSWMIDVTKVEIEGRVVWIEWQAAKDLGLTSREADMLFSGGNSLDDLTWLIEQWEAGEDPDSDTFSAFRNCSLT